MKLHHSNLTHRVLVVDDNAAIHEDFRKILMKSAAPGNGLQAMESALFGSVGQATAPVAFEIDYAFQGRESLEMAQQAQSAGRPYALAFVDGRMPPGWDGIETISQLWQACPDLQVVLCTAYADYSWQEIQRVLGESDSLLILKKPFDNVEVLQLTHALTRKWELQGRLNQMAFYDGLTGLPNRALFIDRLTQTLDTASRYQHKAAVLFIDLDNFKRINDTLGHSLGDDLLKVAAERLVKCLRTSDTLARTAARKTAARLGGDEFTVILPKLNRAEEAGVVAQRITEKLAQPMHLGSHQVIVTASIGIAIFPQDGGNTETLLKNADIAMYFAKRIGPNAFRYYQESMNAAALKRLTVGHHLRQALARDEFTLLYQPQFDLATGQVCGMEALLRWHNWELGNVPPLEFMPLAEESGLSVAIGEWVLRTACRQAKAWLDQGLPLQRMAVNVSVKQFTQADFLDTVRTVLAETALEPQRLELEITESLMVKNLQWTAASLQGLKDMNVRLAIDDLGTGLSSLRDLKKVPFDSLKIDDSFVGNIDGDPKDRAIICAIIAMAEGMNVRVIAEGVETTEQADFLRGKHCLEAQGHLFSRALLAPQAELFLRQGLPPAVDPENAGPESPP